MLRSIVVQKLNEKFIIFRPGQKRQIWQSFQFFCPGQNTTIFSLRFCTNIDLNIISTQYFFWFFGNRKVQISIFKKKESHIAQPTYHRTHTSSPHIEISIFQIHIHRLPPSASFQSSDSMEPFIKNNQKDICKFRKLQNSFDVDNDLLY